ncbi:MAG TPA: hypothetical protein VM573_06795, partial [Actinomycetota bacterium]|nr:hypothetical protein [Actinomycetota bacterium]
VATLGVVAFGERPPEDRLHLLYGGMALAVLPFASFFSSEAPPPTRARVFIVAGVVLSGFAWRAAATGT